MVDKQVPDLPLPPDVVFYFEMLVFFLVLAVLSLTVYQDIKTRLVDGIYWLILFAIAIPVTVIRLVLYWDSPTIIFLLISSMAFGIIFSVIIAYFGLWGGADILAMIVLSLTVPLSITQLDKGFILNQQDIFYFLPFSINLIMNASIIQLPLPFFIFFKNVITFRTNKDYYNHIQEPIYKKILAGFIGQPLPLATILKKPIWYYQVLESYQSDHIQGHYNTLNQVRLDAYPIPFVRLNSEKLHRWQLYRGKFLQVTQPRYINKNKSNDKWSFDFSLGLKSEEEDLFRQRTILHHALEDKNKNALWVQYSVPFLLPLTIGFVLSFFNINILFLLFKSIL